MADTKTHILSCAFQLFLQQGYEQTTMMDLVRASGLSKGAFYHHFANKEELHLAAIEHFFLQFFRELDTQQPQTLEQHVRMLWASHAGMLQKIQGLVPDLSAHYRFLFSIFPRFKSELVGHHQQIRARLLTHLQQLQTAGQVRSDLSAEAITDHVLALIEGLGMLMVLQQPESIEAHFEQAMNSYLQLLDP